MKVFGHASKGVSIVLFCCLFAAQASLIAVLPTLADVARDLDVSTAAAGQLRTVAGLAAAATALGGGALTRRLGLRAMLRLGLGGIAAGSLASAVAPGYLVLAAAQLPIGGGVALVVAAGTAAVAEWAPPEDRARVLAWALSGQPGAWVVGAPLIGLVGESSWRYGWLAVPLAATLVAALSIRGRPRSRPAAGTDHGLRSALGDPAAARWAAGELFANAGWAGTLVYAGALLVECYDTSTTTTATLLAAAAVIYAAAQHSFRGLVDADLTAWLARLALLLAVSVTLFGVVRPGLPVTLCFLSASAFLAGGRTLLGNAFGLSAPPERRLALLSLRSAATQVGYVVGAAAGGLALAVAGYAGVGMTLGVLFAAAALSSLDLCPRRISAPAT